MARFECALMSSLGLPRMIVVTSVESAPPDAAGERARAGTRLLLEVGMALEPTALEQPTTRTECVCPMCPEIVRTEPGSWPFAARRTVTAQDAAR